MGFKSDIEIAQECEMLQLLRSQRKQVLTTNTWSSNGKYKDKNRLQSSERNRQTGRQADPCYSYQPDTGRRRKNNDNCRSCRRYAEAWQKRYGCAS